MYKTYSNGNSRNEKYSKSGTLSIGSTAFQAKSRKSEKRSGDSI